eukprot:CAMPEP_0167769544 /NCGR_PEP_ID=MMETSP0110_2-20121227/17363_1 /TAXON_ID=629695 /ORGANISM="Gymnochlora sp., Strain CCMP2014" /LENGTH=953 /DNA_ID=CAMNT_0007658503 /DNA_START=1030 /DNA_END=3892 /DNA_ORIENTATION=+
MKAYAQALSQKNLDKRTTVFILEQMCLIVRPKQQEKECLLILRKSRSQEEYIRGSMNKNPYSSRAFEGTLMAHVKDKICRDVGLPNEANMIELLVNGKIINQQLPILKVYEKVWKPTLMDPAGPMAVALEVLGDLGEMQLASLGGINIDEDSLIMDMDEQSLSLPMIVTYRLTGLDGEATEDVVDTIPDDEKQQRDPEEEFADVHLSLKVIVFNCSDVDHRLAEKLIKMLEFCCKLKSTRRYLLEKYPTALAKILNNIIVALDSQLTLDIAKSLLGTIITVFSEFSKEDVKEKKVKESKHGKREKGRVSVDEKLIPTTTELSTISSTHLEKFLVHLEKPYIREETELVENIMRMLSSLVLSKTGLSMIIIRAFKKYLSWKDIDADESKERDFFLKCFVLFSTNIPVGPRGNIIRDFCLTQGIVDSATSHLRISKAKSMEKHSTPFILQILAGLCKGFKKAQQAILDSKIIGLLHKIEGRASNNRVGPMAESLLQALELNNPSVKEYIESLRHKTKLRKKKIANKRRRAVLKKMGFKRQKNRLTANMKIAGLESLGKENRFKCMVCQEGYDFKPRSTMGFYVFNKEVAIGDLIGAEDEIGLTSVTHFNMIHYTCHEEAVRADAKLKPMKREWEGATIRNSHTLCNNLFPMLGPDINVNDYAVKVEKYWRDIPFRSSFQMSRVEIMIEDLRLLLARFAYEESFSEFAKGGGKESNMNFIPFMIQMTLHFTKRLSSNSERIRTFKSFINCLTDVNAAPRNGSSGENPDQDALDVSEGVLVESLLFLPSEYWKSWKYNLLERLFIQAIPSENDVKKEKRDIKAILRPVFLLWGLIDKLHGPLGSVRSFKTKMMEKKDTLALPESSSPLEKMKGLAKAKTVKQNYAPPGKTPNQEVIMWTVAQRQHVLQRHQQEILDDLQKILKFFNDELLPCSELEQYCKALGVDLQLLEKVKEISS